MVRWPAPEQESVKNFEYPFHDLTHGIIGAALRVYRTWAFGLLEKPHRRALVVELEHSGLASRCEVPFELYHRGVRIGVYRADLIVENKVLVEVKSGLLFDPAAIPQTLNYLKASGLIVGLITYFGPRMKIKRVTNFDAAPEHPAGKKDMVTDCTEDTDHTDENR